MKKYFLLIPIFSLILIQCGPSSDIVKDNDSVKEKKNVKSSVEFFTELLLSGNVIGKVPASVKLNDVLVDESDKRVTLIYNKDLGFIPFRKENVEKIYSTLSDMTEGEYIFSVQTLKEPIENLIPNYYRGKNDYDNLRQPLTSNRPLPVVQRSGIKYESGLYNKNIIVWHSHGWYYNNKDKRWEWQRPRLFQSVEDLIPLSFTVPYLIPMLENAGAVVFDPRERDFQVNEVIVDNSDAGYSESSGNFKSGIEGFAHVPLPLTTGVNPFKKGDTRFFESDTNGASYAQWLPEIPETGSYAVYISYTRSENNAEDAEYTINYYGGSKKFIVNQQIGGSTWIYLGTFKFKQGIDPLEGSVRLSSKSKSPGKILSADAVRFGGGMGIVERGGSTSGRAKFFECARYWLQAAGMPDTLVYNLNKDTIDYNDDYQCRSEYGNYLKGAPFGPNRKRDEKGLGIPIDLSLAFHTDAGITHNDTTIGTLAIYTLEGADSTRFFPDKVSRLACRDVSDIIQTQITDDMKRLYDPVWSRRQLMESQYSESYRPNVPAMLLELLSHQNFLDMQYVQDPRFRFDVARAIYKGMLRFLSSQYNYDFVVQPLPVKYFATEFSGRTEIKISWQYQPDELEPTAVPDNYILYTRIDDKDFNTGELVTGNSIIKILDPGKVYSFKVTAFNKGGESFPSEILSAGIPQNSKGSVLIVNGFDRICGPAAINSGEFAGFMNDLDDGVPDKYDFNFTGRQYDYDINSPWLTNDAPGHGASSADYETTIIAGNSFDYPFIHGKSLMANGYSFVSKSDEAFGKDGSGSGYKMIDYILGEEKETGWQKASVDSIRGKQFKAFTPDVISKISEFLNTGGNLFISGEYLGAELYADSVTAAFAKNVLKIKHITTHASRKGEIAGSVRFMPGTIFNYNTLYNDKIYTPSFCGSVGPVDNGEVLLRYSENQFSAGTGFRGKYKVAGFCFPFETINGQTGRDRVMKGILDYFEL